MSEQEMEVQEVEVVETTETDLDEAKKASMGDPSEVPEPEAKDAKAPGGDGKMVDKTNPAQGSSNVKPPKTKVGMINAMVEKMKGMKKADLASAYFKKEDLDMEEDTTVLREIQKVSAEDINVSEDIEAIFGGQELSEEFVEKASTIFEAAVVSKVNEILETVTVDLEAELESEKEDIIESVSAKLDDYLEYVAEEWMKENELAVEQGIKSEIVENFMVGLRNLFTENYIDIPEEKVDLVDELASKVAELEESLNDEMAKSIELRKEISESKKDHALADVCEGLTDTQIEKMKSLAEGVDFEDVESYTEKLGTIKENYFPAKEEALTESFVVEDEPVEIEEETQEVTGPMSVYMNAISSSIKK